MNKDRNGNYFDFITGSDSNHSDYHTVESEYHQLHFHIRHQKLVQLIDLNHLLKGLISANTQSTKIIPDDSIRKLLQTYLTYAPIYLSTTLVSYSTYSEIKMSGDVMKKSPKNFEKKK